MAVTYSRYKFVTVLLSKRFRNGRFTSETAARFNGDFSRFRRLGDLYHKTKEVGMPSAVPSWALSTLLRHQSRPGL
jgi:hypothetical protein